MSPRISNQDREHFARLKADELSRFFDRVSEGRDAPLLRAAYVLFLKLFEAHAAGGRLNKGQAFSFIPFKHPATCNKVLEEAEAQGFITLQRDSVDTRQRWVLPTAKLLDFMTRDLDESIQGTLRVVAELSSPARKRGGSGTSSR